MKRITTIILSIILASTLIGTDAFAVSMPDNAGPAKAAVKSTKSPDKTETKKDAKGKDAKNADKEDPKKKNATKKKPEKLPKLAKPKKLRSFSDYRSVRLKWTAVPKAEEYIILRSKAGERKFKQIAKTNKTSYVDKMDYIYNEYAYRVIAIRKYKDKIIKSHPAKVRGTSVMRLRVYITFKKTKKIDGVKVPKGITLRSDAYAGGHYYFTYKGKRLGVPNILVRVEGKKYEPKENYTNKEASLFINDILHRKKVTTEKKYIIWVSTYTQHLYVFKRKKGKWKVVKDWEVSTGTSVSPTPTGLKTIHKKVFNRHGIQFWSCFSTWNAMHGISGNMAAAIGKPASHGCVRNNTGNAAWIFAKCPKGTRVLIY